MNTLIILHGWQSSKEKWQKVKEIIEAKIPDFNVVCLDLPGFKPENQIPSPWSLDDYVSWLDKKLAESGAPLSLAELRTPLANENSVYLLGHSFGGRIAIKFAEKWPNKLKGLILVSAAGIKQKKTLRDKLILFLVRTARKLGIQETTWKRGSAKILRVAFYRYILRKQDYLKANPVQKEIMKSALEEDLKPLLGNIKTKTLIVWGDKDKLTPVKDAYLMKEKIQNSELEILKGFSHTPHLECPELVASKIAQFLEKWNTL